MQYFITLLTQVVLSRTKNLELLPKSRIFLRLPKFPINFGLIYFSNENHSFIMGLTEVNERYMGNGNILLPSVT